MDEIVKRIGSLVRELRSQAGLTQEKLAEKANLHWTYVSGIERGINNPSISSLFKIAEALNISLSDFFKPLEQIDLRDGKSNKDSELYSQFFSLVFNQSPEVVKELHRICRTHIELLKEEK